MNILIRIMFATVFLALFSFGASSQIIQDVRVSFESPAPANTPFPIVARSTSACTFPYAESEQPPDFILTGNLLDMTVYLRNTSQSGIPNPPCTNRPQIYAAPMLPPGTYKLLLSARFFQAIGTGSFGPRFAQGEFIFEVGGAVPITQIPATSGWSLALLLLGMLGAVRWVSVHSGR